MRRQKNGFFTVLLISISMVLLAGILGTAPYAAGITRSEAQDIAQRDCDFWGSHLLCGCHMREEGQAFCLYGYLWIEYQQPTCTIEVLIGNSCYYYTDICTDSNDLCCLTLDPCCGSGDPCCGVQGCCS